MNVLIWLSEAQQQCRTAAASVVHVPAEHPVIITLPYVLRQSIFGSLRRTKAGVVYITIHACGEKYRRQIQGKPDRNAIARVAFNMAQKIAKDLVFYKTDL